jgi:DNA-binding response OmpR family regulator
MKNQLAKPYHFLVDDDEEGMRASLKELLDKQGYWVSTAESSNQALTILQNNKVDLIRILKITKRKSLTLDI